MTDNTAPQGSPTDRIMATLAAQGIQPDAEVSTRPRVQQDEFANHPTIVNDFAPPAQVTPPSNGSGSGGPQRDPATGQFVAATQEAAPPSTSNAADAAPTAPVAESSPSSSGKTVKIFGLDVPVEEAEEVLSGYQQMAREELTAKNAEIEAQIAEIKAENERLRAEAAAKSAEADEIINLARANQPLFREAVSDPALAATFQNRATPSMTPEQVQAMARAEFQRLQAESEAKHRQASLEQQRNQVFETTVRDVFRSTAGAFSESSTLKEAVGAQLTMALKEGKIIPVAPAAILKRQIANVVNAVVSNFRSDVNKLTQRQAAVNATAPTPVVGGGTPMPKQDAPKIGPDYTNRDSINSRIMARYQNAQQSSGGNI